MTTQDFSGLFHATTRAMENIAAGTPRLPAPPTNWTTVGAVYKTEDDGSFTRTITEVSNHRGRLAGPFDTVPIRTSEYDGKLTRKQIEARERAITNLCNFFGEKISDSVVGNPGDYAAHAMREQLDNLLHTALGEALEIRSVEVTDKVVQKIKKIDNALDAMEDETDETIDLAPGVYRYAIGKIRQAILLAKYS